ncbi:MAG: rRNA (cytosine1402-N4)-methyltransferase [Verrucomicrobiota bacterium]
MAPAKAQPEATADRVVIFKNSLRLGALDVILGFITRTGWPNCPSKPSLDWNEDIPFALYPRARQRHAARRMADLPPQEKPPRRPRYRGSHPRHFHEKYKEHNPDRYAADVARIVATGRTPAGGHRPVLVREVMEALAPQPGDIAVDCTLGYGGHALELLGAIQPGGRLVALDVDPIELPKSEARLRERGFGPEMLIVRRQNFAGLAQVLAREAIPGADRILADLGLSSMQMDNPARGFTFKREGPLDLRMNPSRGQPVSEWLSSVTQDLLADVLRENSDEPQSAHLARAILVARKATPILTTTRLAGIVSEAMDALPGTRGRDETSTTIRRVFQALRIQANDEFSALETFLRRLPECLKAGGRVVILTFHSGEDRRVKKYFQEGARTGAYESIAEEVGRAGADEIRSNPRASSAKLRWAVRSNSQPF